VVNLVPKEFITPSDSDKKRYKKLSLAPPEWKRTNPEQVAKDMELSFLYKYG
tara:strand:- start:113707 stop:113862 length:156 start_codon:yes stop_codon:yes gene_type:complete